MQRTAESFAASDPLAPLAAACNELHTALSASPDAAFNAATVRSFANLVFSSACYAGDETNLAHVEEHYDSGAFGDPGADDKCSQKRLPWKVCVVVWPMELLITALQWCGIRMPTIPWRKHADG